MRKMSAVLLSSVFLTALLCVVSVAPAFAYGGHSKNPPPKKDALLLVTFGTSVQSAQKSFEHIEKKMQAAFPNTDIRWAYTSQIIRRKLAGEGKMIDSPEIALARLMDEGYREVTLQSLHILPGAEFHALNSNARKFEEMRGGIRKIRIGYPLLMDNKSMDQVLEVAFKSIIPDERKAEDAVVFMGHGSHHPADAIYSAMMYKAQKRDPNCFVGTVEGSPTFEEILDQLKARGVKKAYLIPFMTVAGDHSINDMSGKDPDSWESQLKKAGIKAVPVLHGLAEYDGVVDVWIQRLKASRERQHRGK